MVKMIVGLVLPADNQQIELLKEFIEDKLCIDIIYLKTSYGKLWIKEGDQQ